MVNQYMIMLTARGMGLGLSKSFSLKKETREDAECTGGKKEQRLGKLGST